jgi:hypothetical protein
MRHVERQIHASAGSMALRVGLFEARTEFLEEASNDHFDCRLVGFQVVVWWSFSLQNGANFSNQRQPISL